MDPDPASFILFIAIVNYSVVFGLVLLLVLLVCSALISGAEVAFFSLTAEDIKAGLEQKSKRIEIIAKLLERPKKIIGHHTGS